MSQSQDSIQEHEATIAKWAKGKRIGLATTRFALKGLIASSNLVSLFPAYHVQATYAFAAANFANELWELWDKTHPGMCSVY